MTQTIPRVVNMSTKPTKAAVVTGASRGIGKDIAMRLADDGFAVTVGYASNRTQADATVAEIRVRGGDAIAVQGDVGDEESVERLFWPRSRRSVPWTRSSATPA